jgi:hypothetical protein
MSMKRWAAFRRPKDMKGNSNRPKGVVMVVFCMSPRWTGIWLYALTRSILRRSNNQRAGGSSHGSEDGIAVGNGPGVEISIVSTGTPTVVLLGHDM